MKQMNHEDYNESKWWNHAIVNLVEYVTFDESDIEDMENTENIMSLHCLSLFVIKKDNEKQIECVKCGKMFRIRCGLIFHIERNNANRTRPNLFRM